VIEKGRTVDVVFVKGIVVGQLFFGSRLQKTFYYSWQKAYDVECQPTGSAAGQLEKVKPF